MRTTGNILVFTFLLTLFLGCEKEKKLTPEDSSASSTHLKVIFSHTIDGADVLLDSVMYLNQAGNLYSIVTLKYFISNFTLYKGGDSVVIDDAHYLDIRDEASLIYSPKKTIGNGAYDSIAFVFGLDSTKNKTDFFINPPESNMAWPYPMGGGYHYMQLEGKFDSSGVLTKNYDVHTGALMGVPHYIKIHLSQSSFIAKGNKLTINLSMNINEWFKNPNTYDFNVYGDTMMGDQTAQQKIAQNGLDVFTISSIK